MKKFKLLVSIFTIVLTLIAMGVPSAFAAQKSKQEDPGFQVIDATPTPGTETHYEYDVPNFSLIPGEAAFTTRSGYGFVIEDDFGPDYNDIDITFNVTGTAVLLDLAVIKYSDYASNPTVVKNNPSAYAVGGVKHITAAGSGKSVSFLNLPYNTYVVLWKNVGSKNLSVNSAHIATSW